MQFDNLASVLAGSGCKVSFDVWTGGRPYASYDGVHLPESWKYANISKETQDEVFMILFHEFQHIKHSGRLLRNRKVGAEIERDERQGDPHRFSREYLEAVVDVIMDCRDDSLGFKKYKGAPSVYSRTFKSVYESIEQLRANKKDLQPSQKLGLLLALTNLNFKREQYAGRRFFKEVDEVVKGFPELMEIVKKDEVQFALKEITEAAKSALKVTYWNNPVERAAIRIADVFWNEIVKQEEQKKEPPTGGTGGRPCKESDEGKGESKEETKAKGESGKPKDDSDNEAGEEPEKEGQEPGTEEGDEAEDEEEAEEEKMQDEEEGDGDDREEGEEREEDEDDEEGEGDGSEEDDQEESGEGKDGQDDQDEEGGSGEGDNSEDSGDGCEEGEQGGEGEESEGGFGRGEGAESDEPSIGECSPNATGDGSENSIGYSKDDNLFKDNLDRLAEIAQQGFEIHQGEELADVLKRIFQTGQRAEERHYLNTDKLWGVEADPNMIFEDETVYKNQEDWTVALIIDNSGSMSNRMPHVQNMCSDIQKAVESVNDRDDRGHELVVTMFEGYEVREGTTEADETLRHNFIIKTGDQKGDEWLSRLDSSGGTNPVTGVEALKVALKDRPLDGKKMLAILMTDGSILDWQYADTMRSVKGLPEDTAFMFIEVMTPYAKWGNYHIKNMSELPGVIEEIVGQTIFNG